MDFFQQLLTDPPGFYAAHQLLVVQMAVNSLLALSMAITLRCGMLTQANVGFMCLGAYTSVLLEQREHVTYVVTAIAAALVTTVVAVPLFAAVRRLSGIFLAIATIAFGQVVTSVVLLVPFTGEGNGLINTDVDASPAPVGIAVVAVAYLLWRVGRSRLGQAWTAIREDEVAAATQGIDVRRYQGIAFLLGALLSGLAGALDAHTNFFVDTTDYPFSRVVLVLVFAVAGGATTAIGPILGATLLTALPEILRFAQDYRDAIDGAVLVLVVLLRPQGLLGRRGGGGGPLARGLEAVRRWRRRRHPAPGPPAAVEAA